MWTRPSFPIRVMIIHFFLLALPLFVASFFLFERFYEDQKRFVQASLSEDAAEAMLFLTSLAPVPTQGLDDVMFFLPKDVQQAQEKLRERFMGSKRASVMLISSNPIGVNEYPVLGVGWGGITAFTSGGAIESILRKGDGDFVEYFSDPQHQEGRLIYMVGKTATSFGGPPHTILLVKQEIDHAIAEWFANHPDRIYMILNAERVILKSSDPKFEGHVFPPELTPQEAWLLQNSGTLGPHPLNLTPIASQGYDDTFFFQGQTYLTSVLTHPRQGYTVRVSLPYWTIFHDTWIQFVWIYVLYFLICGIGFFIALFVSSWLSKPLDQIRFVMNQVQAGRLAVRYRDFPFGFEINELGHRFNDTLVSFLHYIQTQENARVEKETYQKELLLGQDVEKRILSLPWPSVRGVTYHASYLVAQEARGDFYCIDAPQEDRLILMLGDAAGKGIGTCLYGIAVRSLLRSYVRLYSRVGEVLSATNNTFLEQVGDSGQFVTVFLGAYEPASHTFTYFSCGHPAGIIKKKHGALYPLMTTGLAMGLARSTPFKEIQVILEQGDLVVLYTKGLIEGINRQGQSFSLQRLKNALQQRSWVTPREVCEGLQEEYLTFTDNVSTDEVIVVAFQVKDHEVGSV